MKTLLQFLAAFSWAAKPNENDSFRSKHNKWQSLTKRVPAFRSKRKADKATADCDPRHGKEKTTLSPPHLRVSRLNSTRYTSK
jgi:hypothetical protein